MASRKQSKTTTPVKGKRRLRPKAATGLAFNHAMVYVADVARSLAFYRDALGFRVVDQYPGAYARLVAPAGGSTIALHCLEPGQRTDPARAGIRLYFEVLGLARFCRALARRGVVFDQAPRQMPWGWKHAYLKDPDGHELSLYHAGAARLRPTRMRDLDH
jgi:catechol 2,3-dioxygenase-like lactoylglutathione lyase family enzyme